MKRWIWRLLLVVLIVLYSVTVYSWWVEGTNNFNRVDKEGVTYEAN